MRPGLELGGTDARREALILTQLLDSFSGLYPHAHLLLGDAVERKQHFYPLKWKQ